MADLPTRWSYSSLSTYLECPKSYHLSYIMGVKTPPSPAMARGSRLHKQAENFLNGTFKQIPYDLAKVSIQLHELRQRKAKPERTWLLDRNWHPVEDQSKAWIKSIVDVHYLDPMTMTLYVEDFKTGQEYDSHRDQLELYAIKGMIMYPGVERVDVSALYIDQGRRAKEDRYLRAMLPKLQEKWHANAVRMMEDRVWEPTPSPDACKWCDFNKKRGGPCEAGV